MKKYFYRLFIVFTVLLLMNKDAAANDSTLVITENSSVSLIGKYLYFFEDKKAYYSDNEIADMEKFIRSETIIPVFNVAEGNTWIKFSVVNRTAQQLFNIELQYPNISYITFYKKDSAGLMPIATTGNSHAYSERKVENPNFIFPVALKKNDTAVFYIKIKSIHPIVVPIYIRDQVQLTNEITTQNLFFGLYFGIMIALVVYNLFLFISTKDRGYFIYIIFLICLTLAQITLSGYGFKYLWPNTPVLNNCALTVSSSLAGIAGILFSIHFLRIHSFYKNYVIIPACVVIFYFISSVASISGNNELSYNMLNYGAVLGGLVLIVFSLLIWRKGFTSAYYYFIAWTFFLASIIIFALRNLSIVPSNFFTTYIIYFGSALEALLLSFALADSINILRKEKETSQNYALNVARENEKLIKEQNIVLEQKVAERTEELTQTNQQLSDTLLNLKDTQAQLVNAEKMASLGQLTAGVAHEINNPINFVKSNIKPLRLDIEDLLQVIDQYNNLHSLHNSKLQQGLNEVYQTQQQMDLDFVKKEIHHLIEGIEEGAERTAEIVRSLRTFSRVDEGELKIANIHDGIDSTLVLLRNNLPRNIKIIRDYKANGNIECYPGKLNQVFMNIFNNSIQAIAAKKNIETEESILVTTTDTKNGSIQISIKDTGIGMTEDVKRRIFEPFFTTKEVGEGTGLGMAIVFKIIENHFGAIDVFSESGKGAEFILTLPHQHPVK